MIGMTRIPLRKYIQEIEILIENGNLNEAQKHCFCILKTFPKNIDTYRLLGKVLLGKENYEGAAYIFNQVLEVYPSDFVAHIGLSFIAEVQDQLDPAILHMERAFELYPTNPTIREELKRLRLKKDGVEPKNILLTRGTLINMYMRSALYPQAIAELRIGWQTNPSRIDFKEILAEALLKQGETIEALQTSLEILEKAPFNFTANRIAFEILPISTEALDVEAFHHHLIDVDPYYLYVNDQFKDVKEVPDIAVSIDRCQEGKFNLEFASIRQDIEKYWKEPIIWKEADYQNSEIDWDSIIKKKSKEEKEETKKISLQIASEEKSEQTSLGEKKEEQFEGKKEQEQNMNHAWFPENSEMHDMHNLDITASEKETNIKVETKNVEPENSMIDENAPTISEIESSRLSQHWIKIDEEISSQTSLEDTQKINSENYVKSIFEVAVKAVNEKEFPIACEHFRLLLERNVYIDDIIHLLEDSPNILENEPQAWNILGKAYQKTNQNEKAQYAFRKAKETHFS